MWTLFASLLTFGLAVAHDHSMDYMSSEYCSRVPSESRNLRFNQSRPFVIAPDSMKDDKWCYRDGLVIPVILAVNDIENEYYTGFFMQAIAEGPHSMPAEPLGMFSTTDEFPDVKIESCRSGKDNTVMNGEEGQFAAHKVLWTAPYDFTENIVFKATFMNSARGQFWHQEIMFPLRYDPQCEGDIYRPLPTLAPTAGSGSMVLFVAAGILAAVNTV